MTDRTKPILCVDFDGVIHSYTSPWTDAATISDPPVPGAMQWLAQAIQVFTVWIYSSRSKDDSGRSAMCNYIRQHAGHELGEQHPLSHRWGNHGANYPLTFSAEKPAAFLTIDDRAICFQGDWSALDPAELLKFKPWNKRPAGDAEPQAEEPVFEIADAGNLHDSIKIYASGRVEFYSGGKLDRDPPSVTITNRISQLLARARS